MLMPHMVAIFSVVCGHVKSDPEEASAALLVWPNGTNLLCQVSPRSSDDS